MDTLLYDLREIPLKRKAARDELAAFLACHDLTLDPLLERYFGIFCGDSLVAGAGYDRNVIKCAAVDDALRGEGFLLTLVSHILSEMMHNNIPDAMVFTKVTNRDIFQSMGFSEIVSTSDVSLLTNAPGRLHSFKSDLAAIKGDGQNSAIVMNCNPFTLGHRYLVEQASGNSGKLFLFVVKEDASVFPFDVRLELVKKGTADIPNVTIIPGGPYIISSATFPTYFLKDATRASKAHAELDLALFAKHIAPAAGIRRRYVGEEPNCLLTAEYNDRMQHLLPPLGVEVCVIPRKTCGEEAISASRVRSLLAAGDMAATRPLLPDSTFQYLMSPEAEPVLQAIKKSVDGIC